MCYNKIGTENFATAATGGILNQKEIYENTSFHPERLARAFGGGDSVLAKHPTLGRL
jgi:hypothetical protein